MKIAGKKVVDANRPLLLQIKPNDVKNSDRKKADNCAAVVACKRQEHVKDVRVHLAHTYVDVGDKWIRYATPSRMRTEIVAFDRGADFQPGDYKLTPPKPSGRLGAQRKREGKKPRGKKPREYHRVTGVRASQFDNVWKQSKT